MYSSYDVRTQQTSSMFFPHPSSPRQIGFSDVSLETLLAFIHRSIIHASHVHLLGGSTSLLTSPLPPAMAREQRSVGGHPSNHNTTPRCSMSARERWTGPSAIDSVVPVHPSRCSPFNRPSHSTQYIHERLLLIAFIGPFCNPSHFLDV